jgi:hypothetical protein
MDKLEYIVRELFKEIESEQEVDEVTTTGNVAGYNTPRAFKKTDGTGEDDETDDKFVDRINQSTGYKRVTENRYHELRQSEGTPNQKIGVGIREMRKQLAEIDKFVEWYGKIKTEGNLESQDYWKRTQRHLNVMREKLDTISKKIYELSN